MAQLRVDTATVLHSETGIAVFGPRLDQPALLQVPTAPDRVTQVSQVVVMCEDANPKSHGTLQEPIVFGYLGTSDFDRLRASLQKRRSGDPPITFEWEVGQNDFLTSFSYRM